MKERDPQFIPINPVFLESSLELELKLESMQPNTIPGISELLK